MKKKDYKTRQMVSIIGDPEICFDSLSERKVFYLFRDFYILPVLQYPIGNYFVDFAFPDLRVVVEYDGIEHENQKEKDLEREKYLDSQGWIVVRIVRQNSLLKYKVLVDQREYGQYGRLKNVVSDITNEIREMRGKRPIDCNFDRRGIENEEEPPYWIDENGEKNYS